MKPSNEAPELMIKVEVALITAVRGLKVTASKIVHGVLVFCFTFEGREEDVAFLVGPEWQQAKSLFEICDPLLKQIHSSIAGHTNGDQTIH